ncbi:MAG: serine/threonine protein kinase, partial [Roseiflexaceae bacterium]|nr:serine/threonine protein kinase [Roseiflexaceae bacterium]
DAPAPTAILHSATGSSFTLGRALGRGGMASVMLAQQTRPSSGEQGIVALKLLREHQTTTARRLFYHEGGLLPRLQHPHIVRFIERGRGVLPGVGNVDYLATEFVAGETAEDLLVRRNQPLAPEAMLGIVAQIASALDYLHQRGVVHCDLKPGNLMIARAEARVVVIDFGIARAPDYDGQPVAVGTPQYLAPEQAEAGLPLDGRADLYALGVITAELLTGRRLFPRRTTTDVRAGRMIALAPHELPSQISGPLRAVISRCVQPAPADRYESAPIMLEQLRLAVQQSA